MSRRACCRSALFAAVTLVSGGALADELKFDISGKIQSDLRFRLQDESVGDFYDKVELGKGVERNQNLISFKVKASYGKFSGVASTDIYLNAVGTQLKSFGSIANDSATFPVQVAVGPSGSVALIASKTASLAFQKRIARNL